MFFSRKKEEILNEEERTVPLFGYELLKNDVLPDLLGKEHHVIMYWAGKSLARKYPVSTTEELIAFFNKAGWGTLELIKEKNNEVIFELTSTFFEEKKEFTTPLESGFLAEQIQNIKGFITEANETYKTGKVNKVIFQVKWDLHDQA